MEIFHCVCFKIKDENWELWKLEQRRRPMIDTLTRSKVERRMENQELLASFGSKLKETRRLCNPPKHDSGWVTFFSQKANLIGFLISRPLNGNILPPWLHSFIVVITKTFHSTDIIYEKKRRRRDSLRGCHHKTPGFSVTTMSHLLPCVVGMSSKELIFDWWQKIWLSGLVQFELWESWHKIPLQQWLEETLLTGFDKLCVFQVLHVNTEQLQLLRELGRRRQKQLYNR